MPFISHSRVIDRISLWRGLVFIFLFLCNHITTAMAQDFPPCNGLQLAQFDCETPKTVDNTDSISNCTPNGTAEIKCWAIDGVLCVGDRNFTQQISCLWTNGYAFTTALTLSLFLGCFGADRFYLGYPTIGLFKLFTFGGFIVGNWIDILLISTQTLKPADGSNYVVKLNGPRISKYQINNQTYFVPQVTPFEG